VPFAARPLQGLILYAMGRRGEDRIVQGTPIDPMGWRLSHNAGMVLSHCDHGGSGSGCGSRRRSSQRSKTYENETQNSHEGTL